MMFIYLCDLLMLLAWYAVQGLRNDPVSVRLSVRQLTTAAACSRQEIPIDSGGRTAARRSAARRTAANASSVAFTAADLSCLEMFYA